MIQGKTTHLPPSHCSSISPSIPPPLKCPSPLPSSTAGGDDILANPPALGFDHPLRAAQRDDLAALAVTLMEVVFSSLAGAELGAATGADALQRLLFDVFQRDFHGFRCAARPRLW